MPNKKLSPRHVMALLRDHYEGTEYDLTGRYQKGSPHHTSEWTICRMDWPKNTGCFGTELNRYGFSRRGADG